MINVKQQNKTKTSYSTFNKNVTTGIEGRLNTMEMCQKKTRNILQYNLIVIRHLASICGSNYETQP